MGVLEATFFREISAQFTADKLPLGFSESGVVVSYLHGSSVLLVAEMSFFKNFNCELNYYYYYLQLKTPHIYINGGLR